MFPMPINTFIYTSFILQPEKTEIIQSYQVQSIVIYNFNNTILMAVSC